MKKTVMFISVVLGMLFLLGTNMSLAEDAPKIGCKKKCFDKMDGDKNGKVSEAEFLARCKERFSAMDADKDGSLVKDEFQCMGAKRACGKKSQCKKGEYKCGQKPCCKKRISEIPPPCQGKNKDVKE